MTSGDEPTGGMGIPDFEARTLELATEVLRAEPSLGRVRAVAIDGPSGVGKTTFADLLAVALRDAGTHATIVHLDDLLDGWDDIPTMWPRVEEWLLGPLRRGEPGRYRVYDWAAGRFGADWQEVSPLTVLILEGVSSARAEMRPELVASVFLDAPAELRLNRALARDGEHMRAHLLRWAAMEDTHFSADRTRESVTRYLGWRDD